MFKKLYFEYYLKPILASKFKPILKQLNELGNSYNLFFWIKEIRIDPWQEEVFNVELIVTYNLNCDPQRFFFPAGFEIQFIILTNYFDFYVEESLKSLYNDLLRLPDHIKNNIDTIDWNTFIENGEHKDFFNKLKQIK